MIESEISEDERKQVLSEEASSGSDSTDNESELALYPGGSINMGQKIYEAFPHPLDYKDDEAADIFDDGLEDDDSSDDESGLSTNFEELTEPNVRIITKIIYTSTRESSPDASEGYDASPYATDDEAYSESADDNYGIDSEAGDDVGDNTNEGEKKPGKLSRMR